MRNLSILISVLLISMMLSGQENKGELTVVLKGVKVQGTLYVSLYDKEKGFPMQSDNAFKNNIKVVASSTEKVVFKDLPYGEYAISAWHDENGNGKMEKSLIGIPKEGIGVSNDAKGKMGPPKFKDAKFQLNTVSKIIEITVKY